MSHFMTSRVSPLGVLSVYFIVASASARVGYEVESKNEDEEVCKSDVDGAEYRCAVGHCCADGNCCTYYYELWWFWLIWMMIILMSCCCAYHHRKKRQNLRSRRNRTMMQGQYAAACSYPGPPVDKGTLGFCKLPKYDEIIRIPPSGSPPPPYRSHRNLNTIAAIEANSEGVASMKFLSYNDLTSSVLSLVTSIGFNFGQRSSHRQSNMRPQAYDSPDVSLSDSSSTFGNIEDEINNNTVPQHKHIVHIVNCHQNPLQRAETETNFVATSEQTILLEETPCTSANRSKSSPHISRLIGACSQEAPQDNASPLPQSPTDKEIWKPKREEPSRVAKITGKIFAKSLASSDAGKQNLNFDGNDDSSDEDTDGPIFFEIDENNNDSMQSVYSAFSSKCSAKKHKGKNIV